MDIVSNYLLVADYLFLMLKIFECEVLLSGTRFLKDNCWILRVIYICKLIYN